MPGIAKNGGKRGHSGPALVDLRARGGEYGAGRAWCALRVRPKPIVLKVGMQYSEGSGTVGGGPVGFPPLAG